MGYKKHNEKLQDLALELVDGSHAQMEFGYDLAIAAAKADSGSRELDEFDLKEIRDNFPLESTWGLGPNGACEKLDGKHKVITISEFVGGIAVACGIEPKQNDIETVIFYIGHHMRQLERVGG